MDEARSSTQELAPDTAYHWTSGPVGPWEVVLTDRLGLPYSVELVFVSISG